jgi:hypothetical protein
MPNPEACPICLEKPNSPVALSNCQHLYCRECILHWCHVTNTCPVCREQVKWLQDVQGNRTTIEDTRARYQDPTGYPIFLPQLIRRPLPMTIRPLPPDPDWVIVISSDSSNSDGSPAHSSEISSGEDDSELSGDSSESDSSSDRDYSPKRR